MDDKDDKTINVLAGGEPDPHEGTATPQPWEIVREFIREIEKPDATLLTHTRQQSSEVWSSHNWGDIGKRAVAGALRDALSRALPEIKI